MTAREPSAVEVIAEATHRSLLGSWTYDSPVERAVAMWDPRPAAATALAALKAAGFVVATREQIRAMSPSEQAELIGGRTEREGGYYCCTWHASTPVTEQVVGPWREVQP